MRHIVTADVSAMEKSNQIYSSSLPSHLPINLTGNQYNDSSINSHDKNLIPYMGDNYTQSYDDITFGKVSELYIVPLLVVIGTIGNVLILVTIRQRNMSNWSVCYYLGAYAVVNIVILVMILGLSWLCRVTNSKYVPELSDWTCKLWQFLMNVSIYSGVWFVFAMLVDQYIMIWMPLKAQSMCTVFMAKFAIVIIVIGIIVVSVHVIWTYELFPNGCYLSHEPNDILILIWPWVSLTCYCIIPLILIMIFIVLIMYGIFTKSIWKKTQSNYQVPIDIAFLTMGLSTFYVVFSIPATVVNIINYNLPTTWLHNNEFYKQLIEIAQAVVDMLSYLNPTISFFLCVAFSSTFRLELRDRLQELCCEHIVRVYEMQVNVSSSAGHDPEACSETTPL